MKIKSIFHILIFLFIFSSSFSQNSNDSLRSMSYDSLEDLYYKYRSSDIKETKKIAVTYYKKAVAEQNEKEITKGAFFNAIVYDALSQQDSAHYFIDIYISKSAKINDSASYASGMYKKGVIFYNSRNFHQAIVCYTKAYELSKNTDKKYKLTVISNGVGLVKNQLGQRKQALDHFKENLAFFEQNSNAKSKHKLNYLNTLNNLGSAYTHLSEDYPKFKEAYLDSATFYNERGLKDSTKENDLEINTSFLTRKGIILQKQGNYHEAHQYFAMAKKQLKKSPTLNQLPILQIYTGKNFFLTEKYDKAIEYLLKADSLAEKQKISTPFFEETYILLAKCYEEKNDPKNAIKYYNRLREKNIKNDQTAREILEILSKQYDIPSLKDKINQLKNQSTEQEQLSKTLLFISLGLIALLILSIFLYRRRIQRNKKSFDSILRNLKKEENTIKETHTTKPNIINDETVEKILLGLQKFEEKKLFLHKNCNINFVAKKAHTNKTYLSKTLQTHKEKKFVQYITDLRIDYALVQLKNDSKFRAYDIKSIADELGFNTSESFAKAFKKRTEIYPSFYIKNLNKLNS